RLQLPFPPAAAAGMGLTGAAPSLYRKCARPAGSAPPSPDEDGCHPAGAGAGRRLRRMNGPRRVAAPPARPLLLFDGDCGFCRRWILRWKALTRGRVDYAPSQEAGSRFPEIPVEDFRRSVQLVLPDGRVFRGAEAVFASLSFAPRGGRLLSAYRKVPGFAALTEAIYRAIADHRGAASAL